MDDSKDNKDPKGFKGLSNEDAALWRQMTQDVEKLEGRDYQPGIARKTPESQMSAKETALPLQKPSKTRATPKGSEIDRKTAERLRKGQIPIEARLDLHGMNQGQAYAMLCDFIQNAVARGQRCVLVITGKGKTGSQAADLFETKPGILKQKLPEWLQEPSVKPLILKHELAKPNHGGDGARYILLRRNRS